MTASTERGLSDPDLDVSVLFRGKAVNLANHVSAHPEPFRGDIDAGDQPIVLNFLEEDDPDPSQTIGGIQALRRNTI